MSDFSQPPSDQRPAETDQPSDQRPADTDQPSDQRPADTDQPSDQRPAKAELRARRLAARRSRPHDDDDQRVRASLVELVRGAGTVAAYAPLDGEPGGAGLPAALAVICRRLLLPVLLPDNDLDWAVYDGHLVPGRYGLREPTGPRLGSAALAGAALVVVPALAVDRRGYRLGRGGGSYDRALVRIDEGTPVVALLYDGELLDRVPAAPHDRKVTAVCTPAGGVHRL